MLRLILGLVLGSSVLVGAVPALAKEAAKSPVGQRIDDFTLPDFRGKDHSLSELKDSKVVVVAFLGTECPLAKLYAPRLVELERRYRDKGVAFLGINSNRQDSLTEIAAYARVHGIEFPLLKDAGNRVADLFGALRTPEVFVLDAERRIRYRGRIDDQYLVGRIRDEATRHDLQLALDQLLANAAVEVPETEAVGCFIGRSREPDAASAVTYSKHVARVLQNRCVECHRAGEIAPFALMEYEEVAGWAETIAEVVREERMPPWHAAPEYGEFANDRRMSDEEKQIIYDWVAAGAPEGNPADLPQPREFVQGWQLPKEPDLVLAMRDEPFTVPAEGEVRYQYFTSDPGFTEDKWVSASEIIPGNRAVVHHVLIFVQPPGMQSRRGIEDLGFLSAYVPGLRPQPYPRGMAKFVPAGSKLVWQVHYTPIGSEQQDICKVGLIFADRNDVTHMVQTVTSMERSFEIPPGDDNYRVESLSPDYDRDLLLLCMSPHMHLRGKSFLYEARYPNGTKETLLDVPHYDFNWQTTYILAQPKLLPAGTKMFCVAHYDNSENNLANPDPTKQVRWGDQTWEEMMIGFYDVAVELTDEERASGKIARLTPTALSQAEMIFARFDKNKDGKVIHDEVPERGKLMFLALDKNADGELTMEEVAEAIKGRLNLGR